MIKYFIGIGLLSILVVSAVVYGFVAGGTPSSTRKVQLDNKRVDGISELRLGVEDYYYDKKVLPESLGDIKITSYYGPSYTKDPETNQDYVYQKTGVTSYKLCATFSTSTEKTTGTKNYSYYEVDYKHPKGYYCFDLTVTPTKASSAPTNNTRYDSSFLCMFVESKNLNTKVGQTVKPGGNQVVKGIKTKLQFTSGNMGYVSLREISDEKNPESGPLIAKAEIKATFDNVLDRTIYFNNPVTLSKDKAYVFIFESDKSSVMYVYYSDYNPAPTATTFMYTYDVTSSLNEQFTWEKHALSDIYYVLI